MKIQINSLEALTRLIGDDKEMEISVKQAVLDGFAKRYLKSLVNNKIMLLLMLPWRKAPLRAHKDMSHHFKHSDKIITRRR